MAISVFMDYNGYWYLSSVGNLHHNDHTFIPREAEIVKESDVSEKGKSLMEAMYMAGIENSKIAEVMSNFPDGGGYMKEFMRKTAENMCAKMKKADELLRGVTAEMSTAEKAIKYLERYVYIFSFNVHLVQINNLNFSHLVHAHITSCNFKCAS